MLTVEDWITSSGRYPTRASSLELTKEVLENAKILIQAVNSIAKDLGLSSLSISSGFRPSAINGAVGGAKRSGHLRGLALDLVDVEEEIDTILAANPKLLRKYSLFLETPRKTVGWAHIDTIPRVDRPSRIFIP